MFEILRSEPKPHTKTTCEVSQQHLKDLVVQFSRPRHSTAQLQENQQIRSEIHDFFTALGLNVSLQGSFRNVVALPQGYTGEPLTLIGAHYDSVPNTYGADDNASALAAMLSCAKVLSLRKHPPKVAFVAFNAEEDGMLGSHQFVRDLKRQGIIHVKQAHILEMLGYRSFEPNSQQKPASLPIEMPTIGDFIALVADHQSNLASIMQAAPQATPALHVLGMNIQLEVAQQLPVLHRSDHTWFWQQRIPAILWTDTAEYRNPNYHRFTDTPDTLDYDFLQQVTELLITAASI